MLTDSLTLVTLWNARRNFDSMKLRRRSRSVRARSLPASKGLGSASAKGMVKYGQKVTIAVRPDLKWQKISEYVRGRGSRPRRWPSVLRQRGCRSIGPVIRFASCKKRPQPPKKVFLRTDCRCRGVPKGSRQLSSSRKAASAACPLLAAMLFAQTAERFRR